MRVSHVGFDSFCSGLLITHILCIESPISQVSMVFSTATINCPTHISLRFLSGTKTLKAYRKTKFNQLMSKYCVTVHIVSFNLGKKKKRCPLDVYTFVNICGKKGEFLFCFWIGMICNLVFVLIDLLGVVILNRNWVWRFLTCQLTLSGRYVAKTHASLLNGKVLS